MTLQRKVDFIATIEVKNANPNGDPLSGNMPRINPDGLGEISDVCIKRKIRNRMQDMGHDIFVKSKERSDDGFTSLQQRFKDYFKDKKTEEVVEQEMCKKWMDVRAFGQVVTFNNMSLGIRGPVSIGISNSLLPINAMTMQIVRSSNAMDPKGNSTRSSDTMGSKHYVEYGVYVVTGSVNVFYSEKTGFTEEDAAVLKEALRTLFVNDASSARPEGSMEIKDLYWFEHSSKVGDVSSGRVFELLEWDKEKNINSIRSYSDYNIRLNEQKFKEYQSKGLKVEYIEGL